MTDAPAIEPPKTSLVFWLISAVAVLWNSYGAYDYFMSKTGGEAYLRSAGMTDVQIAYFNAMPVWMTAVWAIGVWGALLGAVLLLLRRRLAVAVFAVSLAAFLMSLVYTYMLSDGAKINGSIVVVMNGVILAGCVFFLWFANRMAKQGVLR